MKNFVASGQGRKQASLTMRQAHQGSLKFKDAQEHLSGIRSMKEPCGMSFQSEIAKYNGNIPGKAGVFCLVVWLCLFL